MKKTFLALVASGFFAASAGAIPYSDTNFYGIPGALIQQGGTPFTDQFDITGGLFGYNPSTAQLYSANATFVFTDLDLKKETLTVNLADAAFGSAINLLLGPIVISADLGPWALADLSFDGLVTFTVTAPLGNAYLTSATLLATDGRRVPDGGSTLALLGLALLGITAAHRRLASAS